nr:threonine/serine exporter family protein [Bacillus benzoevorans]
MVNIVNPKNNYTYKVVQVCLLAGEMMLKSGAGTSRVEDTMKRIAASYGILDAHSFVMPTGIIFSIDGEIPTKLVRVEERTTDLLKITTVNSISRKMSAGELTVEEALDALREVEKSSWMYPVWIQIIAAALVSGCFLIMFKGSFGDFIPAMIAGGAGLAVYNYVHNLVKVRFFSEFTASFVIGIIAMLAVRFGIGSGMDKIIIGSVMPLVPGLLITNAVRDLISGHLISGLSKGAEATLTSLSIGTGIAIVFIFFH